ncbi:PP2C family protein-serine/threonine phosphatase [Streptomyces glaucescens]|uniref:protein-serine/threonine phosphatase n=1 Tax=Streptomyces glaucescens TaxID=1907 RepID=A0A089XCT9_STRGA|nr:GAF domain-containing SpoIIE family protein phosphatase [Streptomyces glaucescens]AIS01074.1 magnesium or manganese-dependent protein phosphatase [Streptomyces glaucescens]
MTPRDTWTIRSTPDAARARALLARLTADAGVPAVERARFLADLTARLRQSLDSDGADVVLDLPDAGVGTDGLMRVDVRPHGRPAHRYTLPCRTPVPPPSTGPADLTAQDLADALLAEDEHTATLVARLAEQEELVRLHREELHHTNQGVLALHAELENAAEAQHELLDAERAARADAEKARRLLTFLADASAAVTASLDLEDIRRRLPELLVPDYAERADIWLFDDEDALGGGDRPAAAVAAARSGRPQHAAPHPGGLPGVDDLPPSVLSPDRPLLCIPLTAPRPLGVLTLTAPGRRFDPDTAVMLMQLAGRWAVALDHARRYEQHRDVAEALQRAQLTDLPATDGLRLAARYLPATHGLNIGGDWYDAFVQPDGSVLAVIGDVTGHGLNAAVMMGQLRTALRAYAVEDDSPARILTRLHRMLCHLQPSLYATALVARFRPGDPTLVWAAAGHPPAVVRAPDATVRVLDAKPGIMLGVPMPFSYEDHTVPLPPGSTVALYTDGLVERRAHGIDPGIERLGQVMSALNSADLEDLDASADALLKPLLHDSERDDDVCLLLCHSLPAASGAAP